MLFGEWGKFSLKLRIPNVLCWDSYGLIPNSLEDENESQLPAGQSTSE